MSQVPESLEDKQEKKLSANAVLALAKKQEAIKKKKGYKWEKGDHCSYVLRKDT